MAYAALFFHFLAFAFSIKHGRIGPVFLIVSYSFASIVVFFLNDTGLTYFEPYRGLPLPMFGDYQHADTVYIFGTSVALAAIAINFYLKKIGYRNTLSIYIGNLLKMRSNPRFLLVNYIAVGILFILYIFNVYETEYDLILSNTAYLYTAVPGNVGIS